MAHSSVYNYNSLLRYHGSELVIHQNAPLKLQKFDDGVWIGELVQVPPGTYRIKCLIARRTSRFPILTINIPGQGTHGMDAINLANRLTYGPAGKVILTSTAAN
jgi:hypothetical protein